MTRAIKPSAVQCQNNLSGLYVCVQSTFAIIVRT